MFPRRMGILLIKPTSVKRVFSELLCEFHEITIDEGDQFFKPSLFLCTCSHVGSGSPCCLAR